MDEATKGRAIALRSSFLHGDSLQLVVGQLEDGLTMGQVVVFLPSFSKLAALARSRTGQPSILALGAAYALRRDDLHVCRTAGDCTSRLKSGAVCSVNASDPWNGLFSSDETAVGTVTRSARVRAFAGARTTGA
eukprot:4647833-Pleurochrysis_carterae.AAC.1